VHRQTVSGVAHGYVVKVMPAKPGTGIVINMIPAQVEYVVHHDNRVVLRRDGSYACVVEHPIASLKIMGVHDAIIEGTRSTWDFSSPTCRYAYALGLAPSVLVGCPDGTISGGLVEAIRRVGVKQSETPKIETTVAEPVAVSTQKEGKLLIEPASEGTGLQVRLFFFNVGPLEARLDPYRGLNQELQERVSKARTPLLAKDPMERLYHALGDVIGDVAGTGGVDNAYVEARLRRYYHIVTIGAMKKAKVIPTRS
jgi:UDP-3-O-acyl-N-acetylglucosamine deacetylase